MVDLDRAGRCGFPEVIYGTGKTAEAIGQIAEQLLGSEQPVLATRVDAEKAAYCCDSFLRRVTTTWRGRCGLLPNHKRSWGMSR